MGEDRLFCGYVFDGVLWHLRRRTRLIFCSASGTTTAGFAAGGKTGRQSAARFDGRVHIATVRNQVLLSMFTDFENFSVFKPAPSSEVLSTHARPGHRLGRHTLKTLWEQRARGG
jgi:hypothetical protein